MNNIACVVVDCLTKVFPDQRPDSMECDSPKVFSGERFSFQLAYTTCSRGEVEKVYSLSITSQSSVQEVFDVGLVPCYLPSNGNDDEFYLKKQPGLYPDLLSKNAGTIRPLFGQWRTCWVNLVYEKIDCSKSDNINISITDGNGEVVFSSSIELSLIPMSIPDKHIYHTEWLHTDCLANFYHLQPYQEEHWSCIENYIMFMKNRSCVNMIYTPIFTPALDTEIGGERLTVQLVKIEKNNGKYTFDLSRLVRWCSILKKCQIENIEICHLFTQWGAKASPKICATVDGEYRQIFGWNTDVSQPEYIDFLYELIPIVLRTLNENGFENSHIFFHVSDEPREEQVASYKYAKNSVCDLFKNCHTLDALSNYSTYKESNLEIPVVALNHVDEFWSNGKTDIWVYYCVTQSKFVPNRFIGLPLYRERVLGILMYYHKVLGFLHWGYNFYNSRYSKFPINPFMTTDAASSFPSGDPFIVYPGDNFMPMTSIRNEVLFDSFKDMSLLYALESFKGREFVCSIIEQTAGYKLDFQNYPQSAEFVFTVIEKVKNALALEVNLK